MPLFGFIRSSSRPDVPGPFFVERYPEGFQPRDPGKSLNTAFDVVKGVHQSIEEKLGDKSNMEQAISFSKIKAITFLVNNFQDAMEAEESIKHAFEDFTAGIDDIDVANVSMSDSDSYEAARALADVMEITRKSIPNTAEGIKKGITAKRDVLVTKIQAYEASLTKRRDTDSPSSTASTEPDSDDEYDSDDDAGYKL